MNSLTRILSITLAALIGVFAAQSAAEAGIGPESKSKARPSRIVGLWDVAVEITNCSGTTLFSFPAMHKYEQGGTGQVVPGSNNPGLLSAHMLVWNYAGYDQYQTAMKMFRFDGTGAYIGWVEVVSDVAINEDADKYEGSGTADFYNAAGVMQMTTCPVFSGTRFTGQP